MSHAPVERPADVVALVRLEHDVVETQRNLERNERERRSCGCRSLQWKNRTSSGMSGASSVSIQSDCPKPSPSIRKRLDASMSLRGEDRMSEPDTIGVESTRHQR
jgi:hypothetical protein